MTDPKAQPSDQPVTTLKSTPKLADRLLELVSDQPDMKEISAAKLSIELEMHLPDLRDLIKEIQRYNTNFLTLKRDPSIDNVPYHFAIENSGANNSAIKEFLYKGGFVALYR